MDVDAGDDDRYLLDNQQAQARTHSDALVSSLRPGGWLPVEEADPMMQPLVCPDESGPAQRLANKLKHDFRTLMAKRGVDLAYGRTLPRLLGDAGLADIGAGPPIGRSAGDHVVRSALPCSRSRPLWTDRLGGPAPGRPAERGRDLGEARRRPAADAGRPVPAGGTVEMRPLCAYPLVARPAGHGSTHDEANFRCVKTR
jgi:hypothetical protein